MKAEYRSEATRMTVSGWINGAGGIVISGDGEVEFSYANTYTDDTIITDGTFLASNVSGSVTGDGDVFVLENGTLGGTGFISGITNIEGTLNPGVGNTVGALTINNDVSFESGSSFNVLIAGDSSFDQLTLSGDLGIDDAILQVTTEYSANISDSFEIVSGYTSLLGTFLGLAEGDEFTSGITTYRINYTVDSIDLTVTAIPEPSSFALMVGIIASLVMIRRRRIA
jgi:uncharacterized protein with beta-barrel porin domain